MSTVRIALPSGEVAQEISRGLYLLSRPAGVAAAEGDVTQFFCEWGEEADGSGWIEVDPSWTLPVHVQVVRQMTDAADRDGSRADLARLVRAFSPDPDAAERVRAAVVKGGRLVLGDVLARLGLG